MIVPDGLPSPEDRRRLGRDGRHPVPRSAQAASARLRAGAASDPCRLRDVRHALARAGQRHPRVPRAERRRACGRPHANPRRRKHEGRVRGRRSRRRGGQGSRLVGRHDRARQGVRHRSLSSSSPRTCSAVAAERQGLRPSIRRPVRRTGRSFRSSRSRTWSGPSGRFSTNLASSDLRRWPADRLAACRRSSGPFCILIRSMRSWRSRARTHFSRRVWPGMRSRATRSWRIPPGSAASTTAPDASRTPAWASRGWSATSPTCQRDRWPTSSAGGCSSAIASATR